ncbi:ion transporter [Olivibacter sp. XZL3]|uniref:ion transporter n=1 Tax=Olivibacter sp. XZL3 TaxID=1735116 RepID=UPI001065B0F9|nr:ion transporter [Olivibacter sp. XZL3]
MKRNEHTNLKQKIYTVIFKANTPAGKWFDLALLVLILLSVFSVCLESVLTLRLRYHDYILIAEWTFTVLFTLEYALRVYSSPKPIKYIFSFYGLVDLISFIPTYLSLLLAGAQYLIVIRSIRLLRIFRILKLSRFMYEGNILRNALKASMYKIVVFLTSVVTLVTIIGALMYIVEGEKTGFSSIPTSIYWAIVTITTVGYGDISPQTALGQALAAILMVIGYGIIAVPTGIVSVEMARATDAARKKCPSCHCSVLSDTAKYCQECGLSLQTPHQNTEETSAR